MNNMLGAIIGYSDLTLAGLSQGDPLRADIEQIRKAAGRAALLTRQLLAFSRKQALRPEVVDLNAVIASTETMLRRLIGEDIEFTTSLAPDLGRVKVDQSQLDQVILNLAVNARDAMPEGGKLIVETANVDIDENYSRKHVGVAPGRHAMLAISDTGRGMDEETLAHLFEPFFTTKAPGKGTGLGLSTVYGIVKQSGGSICVYSEPGRGTAVKIYLPRVDEPARAEKARPDPAADLGSETVLVVEDDEAVRELASRILRSRGYTVLTACNGGEALLTCEQHDGPIHAMLTDVVMPQMSGRKLADRIASIQPEIEVLYMSGYTDSAIVHQGVIDPDTPFIQKPFTAGDLARAMRQLLDAARRARPGRLEARREPE